MSAGGPLDKDRLRQKAYFARRQEDAELDHAARDCDACVREGIEPAAYAAEAAVYRQEQRRRGVAVTPEPLATRLADPDRLPLAPAFVAWLRAVAEANGMHEDAIWQFWSEYARTCDGYDQSPVQSEFLTWNKLSAPAQEASA